MLDRQTFIVCAHCGTQVARALLSCPGCHRLVHTDKLRSMALEAERLTGLHQIAEALTVWRDALELLPPGSRQHQTILGRVQTLSRQIDTGARGASAPAASGTNPDGTKKKLWWQGPAGLGAAALIIWKFKFIVVFVLTKGKLLLLGLTKMSTLFSMFLAFGVYWTVWGWKFALGFIVSIYIHEMGHVAALRHFGIRASAPMFIPGLGALVRLKQYPADAREDARVGLAGPLWGLGAAVAAYVVFLGTGEGYWVAIARVGAWLNLFNLLPVWQLDGGRGFRALSRLHRGWVVAAMGAMWFLTSESLLVLLLVVGAFRLFSKDAPKESDRLALLQFIFLIVALSLLAAVPVPTGALR